MKTDNLVLTGLLGFLFCNLGIDICFAQQAPASAISDDMVPPTAFAFGTQRAPVLDGEVLADSAWHSATPITGFWQTTPNEGLPASEPTEVRIIYTPDTLYISAMCYDREPNRIIVSDSRRDASLDETDCFRIILDTYHDRQNGFVFGTNPAGIEYDAQVTGEGIGEISDQVSGFNLNWDAAWKVRTKISPTGWSAEFAIPFRTLRYAKGKQQTWGLNFQRNIRRRNETSYWARLPRQFNLYRLSEAGRLQGLDIKSQRNLKLMPYVLGQTRFSGFRRLQRNDFAGDFGVDAKYSLTPSLTLDATYNTDFAQVEVDELQINLDRFNLFFPEKRPFFLENAGLFSVGSPGEVEMFFSRRIGIGPRGIAVPILGGGRLSGKWAGMNSGVLNMQTEALGDTIAADNFTVARLQKELPNRSALGAIFTNRQGTGANAPDHDYNRVVAIDGRLGLGQNGLLSGYAARSFTADVASQQHAYKVSAIYDSPAWLLQANYTEVGENFDPQVGFLQRRAFRKPDFLVFHTYRPKSFLGLHELRPHVSYRGFWDFDGFQESGFMHIDNHWEWKSGHEIHTGVNFTREGVKQAFEIFPGVTVPAGSYDHREAQISVYTNQGAPLSFETELLVGGLFGGNRITTTAGAKLRVGEAFNSSLRWSRNDIDLPGGYFKTNLLRARLSYSFTPRVFCQALVQYNDRDDLWSTNFRFGWLQAANTGFFLVYNEIHREDNLAATRPERSLIMKYSQLFDLLN